MEQRIECELWQLINTWLATTNHVNVFISKRSYGYELQLVEHMFNDLASHRLQTTNWCIGIIGDDYIASDDGIIKASDPQFFNKLETYINDCKKRHL